MAYTGYTVFYILDCHFHYSPDVSLPGPCFVPLASALSTLGYLEQVLRDQHWLDRPWSKVMGSRNAVTNAPFHMIRNGFRQIYLSLWSIIWLNSSHWDVSIDILYLREWPIFSAQQPNVAILFGRRKYFFRQYCTVVLWTSRRNDRGFRCTGSIPLLKRGSK